MNKKSDIKMKILMLIMIFSLLLTPFEVLATVLCNDNTYSPTCGDCHRGCCSRHGGCKIKRKKKKKKKKSSKKKSSKKKSSKKKTSKKSRKRRKKR